MSHVSSYHRIITCKYIQFASSVRLDRVQKFTPALGLASRRRLVSIHGIHIHGAPSRPRRRRSPLSRFRRIVPKIIHVFPRRSSIPRRSPHLLVFRKSTRRRRLGRLGARRRCAREAVRQRHRERARDAERAQTRAGHAMHRAFGGVIFVNRVRSVQVHHLASCRKVVK